MNLKEYQKTIHTLAIRKGWNTDLEWMELGIFKEAGELVQEIEHTNDLFHDGGPEIKEAFERIGKEFGDVMFFLLQTMHHFNIDLDKALLAVIERNKKEKKKTLENGRIVRK